MVKAFVFGKFLPFHKGHEGMINFALTKCDFLTVLICCSDKENILSEIRKNWIETTFNSSQKIEVRVFNYLEDELPNTSVSSVDVSKIWSKRFKEIFPDYKIVVTSEEYGDYVASFMGIKHISYDIPKQFYPVSATNIRNDIFSNWKFLPKSVKSYFAIKIVILGTESTGKSTLCENLSKHFNCSIVKEAGRDLIANSNSFDFNDLNLVANEHAKRIDLELDGNSPLIIIDTDIHTTMSYANFIFNKELKVNNSIHNSNKADLYLYLKNDVEYIQDGTRLSETERNLLDLSHRNILKEKKVPVVNISGDWETRFNKAKEHINTILAIKENTYR